VVLEEEEEHKTIQLVVGAVLEDIEPVLVFL
jgi:hypothetical protein